MGQIQSAITGAVGSIAMSGIAKRAGLIKDVKGAQTNLTAAQKKAGTTPMTFKTSTGGTVTSDVQNITPHVAYRKLEEAKAQSALARDKGDVKGAEGWDRQASFWEQHLENLRRGANNQAAGKQAAQEQQKSDFTKLKESLSPDVLKTIAIMKGMDYINPTKTEEDKR